MHNTATGITIITAVPGHTIVAQGGPIVDLRNLKQYKVPQVKLVPGQQLVIGTTYRITGDAHPHGLYVKLAILPQPGGQTAVFNVDE